MNSIKNRRSIRKYTNKSLDKETVLEILNAGRLAPSAKNRQPWYFVVLQNKCKDEVADKMLTYTKGVHGKDCETLKYKSSIEATAKIIKEAPVLILIFKNKDENWNIGDNLSIGACVENMLLCATENGIGSLWIRDTYCVSDDLAKQYGDGKELVCSIILGYSAESPNARPRKNLDDIVKWY